MKKIIILVTLLLLGTTSIGYAAEKDSKAQITFENEYIPSEHVQSDSSKGNQQHAQKGKLPQTNEKQNDWSVYGGLLFLGGLWLIKRRKNT
jgi:LPXTG-motif cell wall-anchored protein